MEEKTNCILCNNSSQRTVNRNITFHSFPRDPTRRVRWLQALNLKDCTDWHRVCSEHFAPSDFRPGEKRLLWPFALPKPGLVIQTKKTSETDDNIINDSIQVSTVQNDTTQVSTVQNDSTLQNLNKEGNSVTNNKATSSTVTGSISPRRSCRKVKPSSLSDDSTYVNTLDTSLIPSDQEDHVNNTTHKKKKKKESVSNGMRCSAKNCQNKYPTCNVSFFGFPNDMSLRKIWVKNCGIENLVGPNCIVKSYFKVCRNHFDEDMFYNTLKKNRLVANAVPTIFKNEEGKIQSSHSDTESMDIVESSSTNNGVIIESSNLLSITKKPKVLWNHEYTDTQGDGEPNNCCIPGCIYSADYLNGNINANPRPVALFTPSSANVNDWNALSGLCLTTKSKLCERHFNPGDITSKDIFIPKKGVGKVKALRCDALPVKLKKFGGALKRSRTTNGNEDILVKKTKNNADKLNTFSKFGELPEDANIEIFESDPSTSILNSTKNLNNESIDALSNITSNSSMKNNSQSNLDQILPKILANNSLSISLQPNTQQNKQVLITESTKVTNAISGLNQNKKPVEELSTNSPHGSIVTNLQSNIEQAPALTINDGSLSVTFEKNPLISPIEVANSICQIKSEPLDDENISILNNTSVNNTMSISNSELSSEENEEVFTGVNVIGISFLKSDEDVKSEIIDDIPEAINSFSNDQHITLNTVNNSIRSPNSILKSEPIDDVPLANDSQLNIKQPLQNSSSILLSALQSSCLRKTAVNNLISNTEYSPFIPNEEELTTTHVVSNSLSTVPIIHPGIIENETTFKSNSSNVPCEIIDISEQDTSFTLTEPHSVKDFIIECKNVPLPSQFWISFYNSSQNMAVFIQRDELLNPIKRVYFRNSFVPNIFIKGKPYEYQRAVKTKCDLENLLEDIDDIIICSGYDGYSHETCIGYFENTSEEIEVCRNCQLLIKGKFLHRMDTVLKTKTNILMQLNNRVAEMQIKVANTRKQMLKEKRRY